MPCFNAKSEHRRSASKKMKNKRKIIKLPSYLTEAGTSDEEDEFYDFEEWEIHAELLEKEDYPALVEYCEKRAKQYPDDPYAQYELGDAYVLNGEYEKAIDFMSKHHRKHPYNEDFQYVILDALFALGKNEDDFNWIEKPVVLRMSEDILDACWEFLRQKRKPRSIIDLHTEFVTKGYLLFTKKDLLNGLLADARFMVEYSNEDWLFAEVSVRK
jgi:tetratricopeptide (TPR) repeat protein